MNQFMIFGWKKIESTVDSIVNVDWLKLKKAIDLKSQWL